MFKALSQGLVWALLFFLGLSYAGEENIIISTYYPSPKGVYRTLRLYPGARPGGSCKEGELYFDNSGGQLYLCDNSGWVLPPGGSVGGRYWDVFASPNENDIYYTQTGGVTILADGYNNGIEGSLEATDVFLSDTGKWVADEIRGCYWDYYSKGGHSYIYNTNSGNVGIGTNSPDAKLTVRGNGSTGATTAFLYNHGSATFFLVRDDGNVGIRTNSPQARLDIDGVDNDGINLGTMRIEDGTLNKTDMVLTSDATGLVTWQPQNPIDTRASGGLYGFCREGGSPKRCEGIQQLPASCEVSAFCKADDPPCFKGSCYCPAGYTQVKIGEGGGGGNSNYYACYKE